MPDQPEHPEFPDIPPDMEPAGGTSLAEGPMFDEDAIPEDHRSGYVALVGKPNVGKSTLMNQLVGRKLSIVTRKPQTTRHKVLGIVSGEDYQIILFDTPGFIDPRYGLQKAMMHAARSAVHDADLIVFMAEATLDRPDEISLEEVDDQPAILAVNKIDLINRDKISTIVDQYTEHRDFDGVVPVSAKTGENVDVLVEKIIDLLPAGPPFYPKDVISEHPERFFVAEIIREKIFNQYRQEIPYSTQVNIVEFKERDNGKDFIDAEIVVERSSQKGILIGKGGKALKKVGKTARQDIEEFLERPVYLQLHVKVREDWRDRHVYLRSYGYNR